MRRVNDIKRREEMTLIEHLQELRGRLFKVVAVFITAMVIGLFLSRYVIVYFKHVEPASAIQWNVFSPWDSIRIYINFSFVIALTLTTPVALYHMWAYVKPGLDPKEQKATLMYIPLACLLFLSGLAFGYYVVFPMAFFFMKMLVERLGFHETYGVYQYFSFMLNIVLPLALVFELPIIVMFLTKLHVITPDHLRRIRRMAYMVLVIVSTMITPPDAISAIVVSIPMIALYELSIVLSRIAYGKRSRGAEREIVDGS